MLQELLTMTNVFFTRKKESTIEFFKIFGEYSKVIDVLISCETMSQVKITETMFNNFRRKWSGITTPLNCEVLDGMLRYIDRDFKDQISIVKSNLNSEL